MRRSRENEHYVGQRTFADPTANSAIFEPHKRRRDPEVLIEADVSYIIGIREKDKSALGHQESGNKSPWHRRKKPEGKNAVERASDYIKQIPHSRDRVPELRSQIENLRIRLDNGRISEGDYTFFAQPLIEEYEQLLARLGISNED